MGRPRCFGPCCVCRSWPRWRDLVAIAGLVDLVRFSRAHWAERLYLLFTLAAGTALLVILNYWNLLGVSHGLRRDRDSDIARARLTR